MNQLLHLNHLSPETSIPFLQGLITGAAQGDTHGQNQRMAGTQLQPNSRS